MAETFVTSDLHFGHKNIVKYRPFISSEEHDALVISNWNALITKQDRVIVLGDVAFNEAGLKKIALLNGVKIFVVGNHDSFSKERYKQYFGKPRLYYTHKEELLFTHIPVHPQALRGYKNVHGHLHTEIIDDPNYINVCLDVRDWKPVNLKEIINE